VHVPLILRGPGVPSGRVVSSRVTHLDLVPTLLELLARPGDPDVQGESLVPLLRGGELPARDLFLETLLPMIRSGKPPQTAYEDDRWKVILHGTKRTEVYDLATDPGERRDLAGSPKVAAVVERGRRRIAEWTARCSADSTLDNQLRLDPESLEKLRALGYVDGGGTR
jgi:arylsulfatase A-like enzyme